MKVDVVRASFQRVRDRGLAERFYELLLSRSETIARHFRDTDFARQHDLFLHGMHALLDFAEGGAFGRMALNRLRLMHGPRQLNVDRELFDQWVDSLIETVLSLDPEASPQLEKAWRDALRPGIDLIRS